MKNEPEKRYSNLQKILRSGNTLDDEKTSFVTRYAQKMLDAIELAETPKEKQNILAKLDKMKDFMRLGYVRKSVLEKLFGSTKHPEISFPQGKEKAFEYLAQNDPDFQTSFQALLAEKIKTGQVALSQQKRLARQTALHTRPTRASLPDKDSNGNYNIDKLALVHLTRYKPKKNRAGQYVLESLASATKLMHPRNTLHFTIGHLVGAHLTGNWDDAPYVVIAPLKEMITQNGKPMGLSAVDTFFEVGLNKDLALPEQTYFIEPAHKKLPEGVFFVTHGNRTIYKAAGFTALERQKLGVLGDLPDAKLAELVKKNTVKHILIQQGYLYAPAFQNVDGDEAKSIEQMGKKMGVPSTSGAHLHSVVALSGVNRLGIAIDKVCQTTYVLDTLLNADSILPLPHDRYELSKHNTKLFVSKHELQSYLADLSELKDLDSYLKQSREDLWLKQSSEKEREVYQAWKAVTQKHISSLLKQTNKMDLTAFLNKKCKAPPARALRTKEYV